MDYIIECRLPKQFVESLYKTNLKALAQLSQDLVFFAHRISCPDGPTAEEIMPLLRDALAESLKHLPPSLQVDIADTEVSTGSVIIKIFAYVIIIPTVVAATPPAVPTIGVLAAGGIVAWAADKFFGATLEEWGKDFSKHFRDRISSWWKGKDRGPVPITSENFAEVAEKQAAKVASEYGCKMALLTGGSRVGEHSYQYCYELHDCSKKIVTVTIDAYGKEPLLTNVL